MLKKRISHTIMDSINLHLGDGRVLLLMCSGIQYFTNSILQFSFDLVIPEKRNRKDLYTIETFDFTSNPRFEDDSMYPKEIDGFKDAMLAFRKQTRVLSNKLLRSLGEHLELTDKDFFLRQHRATEENYEKSKFSVRSVYYPKESHIPDNVTKFRMPEHQIFGTFTHLHQSSQGGGLQVKLKNGEWVDVPFIPNSIVVKAGKALEMWTGGNIPAVVKELIFDFD